jgi:hypothetical protein
VIVINGMVYPLPWELRFIAASFAAADLNVMQALRPRKIGSLTTLVPAHYYRTGFVQGWRTRATACGLRSHPPNLIRAMPAKGNEFE